MPVKAVVIQVEELFFDRYGFPCERWSYEAFGKDVTMEDGFVVAIGKTGKRDDGDG